MSNAVISSLCINHILTLRIQRNTKYVLSFRPISYVLLPAARYMASYPKISMHNISTIKNNVVVFHGRNSQLVAHDVFYSTTINKSTPNKVNLEQQVKQMAFLKRQKQDKFEKWKAWHGRVHRFALATIFALTFSLIWSWYDPIHRLESADFNPTWGKLMDQVLGPVDDETKQKYEELKHKKPK